MGDGGHVGGRFFKMCMRRGWGGVKGGGEGAFGGECGGAAGVRRVEWMGARLIGANEEWHCRRHW